MAKKRKGARPAASRGAKKKTAAKGARRSVKAKGSRAIVKGYEGLGKSHEIDFKPLKDRIRAYIERLSMVKDPSGRVQKALVSLSEVQAHLSAECHPSMVLPTS